MLIYAVSKNTGPSMSSPDPVHLLYLGTSVREAEDVVGDFQKYAKLEREGGFPTVVSRHIYSALPRGLDREMIQFFMADGWWYSIEMFELE